MAATAFPYARVSVPSSVAPDLLRGPCLPRLLLARLSGARPPRPLDGVISPQDGKASIALPQWRRRDFLPLGLPPRKRGDPGCAHSSRGKKACPREGGGLSAAILRCAPAPRGAASIACGLSIAHRGRDGRGLEQPRRND